MADVFEFKIVSEGFPGAPGYTTLHMRPLDSFAVQSSFALAQKMLEAQAVNEPAQWHGHVDPVCAVHDEVTGELIRYEAPDGGILSDQAGSLGNAYSAGVAGICIAWNTAGINRGRKIRGRTFWVPLSASRFDTDGTLTEAGLSFFVDQVTAIVGDVGGLGIWSRPVNKLGGKFAPVVSGRVKDQAAILTSRRS